MSVTLIVAAEGATERNFVREVLRPHLAAFDVYAEAREVNKRVIHDVGSHPGGIVDMEPVCRGICAFTRSFTRASYRFTTMVDMYALPGNAPGYREAQSEADPLVRVRVLEQALASRVGDSRFVPYIQLHEFEALVLVHPQALSVALADKYTDAAQRAARLAHQIADYPTPELVDEGPTTHPAARIIDAFPAYAKRKSFVGPAVAAAIGLARLREACPHFGAWVTQLEQLAQA